MTRWSLRGTCRQRCCSSALPAALVTTPAKACWQTMSWPRLTWACAPLKRWRKGMADVVIRGGSVVTPEATIRADVAIEDGMIRAVGPELPGGRKEVDATGRIVFPGVIDVHVHFNEPGHTEWEGAATGS